MPRVLGGTALETHRTEGPIASMTEMVQAAESPRETRLSPGFTSRLNIIADMLVVLGATSVSYEWRYEIHWLPAHLSSMVCIGAALVSTWVVAAAALRHYASFAYDRSLLDEAAMIAIQTSAAITVLALLDLLAPTGTPLPRIP